MKTETSGYCCDLSDFDFDFEIQEKTQNETDFLMKKAVLDEDEIDELPRPKSDSRANFPQNLSSQKCFLEDEFIVLKKKLIFE